MGTHAMMGESSMMASWGMSLGMLAIAALFFGGAMALGYVIGARR